MQNVKNRTDNFIEQLNSKFEDCDVDVFIEKKFPEVRSRYKKKMYDEKSSDTPILNAEKKFEVQVYNVILDNTISSMGKSLPPIKCYIQIYLVYRQIILETYQMKNCLLMV